MTQTRAMRILRLLPIVLGLAWAEAALAHDVSAQIAALEERAKDLRAEEMVLQSQIRAEGNSSTTQIGIAGAQARIDHDHMEIQKLEGLADIYKVSVEEMNELARQYADSPVYSVSDIPGKGGEQVRDKTIEAAIKRAGAKSAGAVFADVTFAADVVEVGGRFAFRILDESRLRQEANAQHLQLNKVLEAMTQFQREIQREQQRIQALTALQERFRANFDALATTNAQIEALRNHRHDGPSAPAAPAAAPARGRMNIRLCDPGQRHQPTGVRAAERAAPVADKQKQPLPKPAEATTADGAACRDIAGPWSMQQSVQLHGKSAPMGPPLRAEIVALPDASDQDSLPRYALYAPDQATARNGPLMRCTRNGYQLSCQRRVQQQACPAARYVWAPLELSIAADLSVITGELRQSWLMDPRNDPSGCTVVAGGQGTIGFRLLPRGN